MGAYGIALAAKTGESLSDAYDTLLSTRPTAINLKVVQVEPERNLLIVRGAIPGARNGLVVVKESRRGA